jgi:hypothetical protein
MKTRRALFFELLGCVATPGVLGALLGSAGCSAEGTDKFTPEAAEALKKRRELLHGGQGETSNKKQKTGRRPR